MRRRTRTAPTASAANPALALAMAGKRSSNAAGKHADRRTRRVRTRAARRARALTEWSR